MINKANFFTREASPYQLKLVSKTMENILNINNLLSFKSKNLKKYVNVQNQEAFLAYRFMVLRQWMILNESYDVNYVNNLDKAISVLKLEDHLNGFEIEYIKHYNGVVFAKRRNIKELIVDFPINDKKEKVYFKYESVNFYENINGKYTPIELDAEIYLSNQRMIFYKGFNIYSLNYDYITDIVVSRTKLSFNCRGKQYIVTSDDNYIIYASMERLFKFINKKV